MGQYEIWNAYVSWHAGCNYSPLTRENKNSTERQSPIYVLPLPKFTNGLFVYCHKQARFLRK